MHSMVTMIRAGRYVLGTMAGVLLLAAVLPYSSADDSVKGRLIAEGAKQVMVWSDVMEATETLKLIQAGVDPAAPRIKARTACIVPNRTRAAMLNARAGAWYEVVVLDGPEAGCKGVVPGAWF